MIRAAGRGQQPRVRHPRHTDVRLGRAQDPHDRQGHRPDRRPGPGPGHETTWAQIVAHELGIPAEDIVVEEGDTDNRAVRHGHLRLPQHARGRGGVCPWWPARSGPRPASWPRISSRCPRKTSSGNSAGFYVRSAPDRGVTIQECAMAAYSNMPDGMEPGLENTAYYDPPNLTWPFAVYIVTVEVDPETGVWDVLNMVAVDDCGVADQPDDRRGADHGRADRGLRHGQHAVHHLRRRGETASAPTTWTTCCRPRGRRPASSCTARSSRRARTTRSGPRASVSAAAVGGPAAFVNAVIDALAGPGCATSTCPAAGPCLGGHHQAP